MSPVRNVHLEVPACDEVVTNLLVLGCVHMHMGWFPQVASDIPDVRMLMPEIRAVIADDEAAARTELRLLLAAETGIQVVAECGASVQAITAVQTLKPDLLLLDTQLPDSNSLHVLTSIPVAERPIVIVTSRHDRDALRAFEAGALDYLVKPLDRQRFRAAIQRTREELLIAHDRHLTRRLMSLLAGVKSESRMDKRLVVKSGGKVILLTMDEIDWIEAAANYVRLQAGEQSYLMREGIGRIANRLDPSQFVRIHRSIIVNVGKIKELHPCNRGEYMVILQDGKELSCSRSYRARLQELITSWVSKV